MQLITDLSVAQFVFWNCIKAYKYTLPLTSDVLRLFLAEEPSSHDSTVEALAMFYNLNIMSH